MSNKGAAALFTGLFIKGSIKKLNISSVEGTYKNKINCDGVQNLKDLFNLHCCVLDTLHMDFISLGNEGLKMAFEGVDNSPLELLTLSRNELTFKRISAFGNSISNFCLLRLDLSRNNLANEGIKALSDLLGINYGKNRISINLVHLNLSNNNITSLGFECFCR